MNEKLADNLDSAFKLAGLIGNMVLTANKGEDYLLTNDELKRILRLLDVLAIYKHNADLDVEKENVPDSNPEEGRWIKDEEHSITIDMFKCSKCGGGGHTHFKFCPSCGKKMKTEMTVDESFEKDRTFKDKYGFNMTVKAYPHGYSIFYADYSSETFGVNDSTENNFNKAMKQLIRLGLIDEKKAEELSAPIKVSEGKL